MFITKSLITVSELIRIIFCSQTDFVLDLYSVFGSSSYKIQLETVKLQFIYGGWISQIGRALGCTIFPKTVNVIIIKNFRDSTKTFSCSNNERLKLIPKIYPVKANWSKLLRFAESRTPFILVSGCYVTISSPF